MITKCDHRLMLLNTQRLKSAIKIISLLLFSFVSFVTPSYGWSLYVGQYTKNKRANEWGAVQDFTKSYAPKNMLNPIAIHNGSGLREISVSNNATELDPGTGLSCNKDHDNHVLTMYHGYKSAGKTYNGNMLWETNIPGMYIGIEVTNINFGGQYWGEKFWINWSNGETSGAKNFDLTNITPKDGRFEACNRLTNWTYYGLGGIVLWVKYHLYIDDSFNPVGATSLSVSLRKEQSYDFQFASSPAFSGSHNVYYDVAPNQLTINYPTCQANAVTGDGVTNSTVPFGEQNAEDISANTITRKFSIKLSNCAYVKELNVTLSSATVGGQDNTLLGNTLTGSEAAGGIGVMIEGEKNPNSPADWTLLKPNISSSIYSFTNSPDYKNSEIGNTEQVMNFQATLKQDGNKAITPGKFKATGKFTITYP
ncbi:fimbrial-like adhesin [Salmonella enterica]|uniref:Fimbrial protein n=1 Tax=Salmonella enterica subsp. enterica serovar Javiana TaxID=363569 RepID=A0A5W4BGQ2_SALET|nr:fimbrial-like adhesin [Salmonella enterica]EBW8004885.1 fimbrial-like adhesin [Salmonella enterica subsp. enterica serovar Javiana]EBW8374977.1 fimbrial-like adhesin [Salmonella enterica subsp. enterica serovar Panama]ECC3366145.1 fimbrial-like adhesin [Salmonella enterica subsp. enterica]EAP4530672.1 fimbrial-like adhesin [Salmonella enterica]